VDILNKKLTVKSSCKICNSDADLFDVVDFNRIIDPSNYPKGLVGVPIYYYQCNNCRFVFTATFDDFKSNDWVDLIYNDVYYSEIDLAYKSKRPMLDAELISAITLRFGRNEVRGLDFGGGNGKMADILKKSGVDFSTYEPFGFSDFNPNKKYNLISSFEVLEHVVNPVETFQEILNFAENDFLLVLSTQTSDGLINASDRLKWSYVSPRNGHVSIYSKDSLTLLGNKFGLVHIPVSRGLHLFGKNIPINQYKYIAGLVKLKQLIYRKVGFVK
jgi:hypothetical protein